MFDNRMKKTLDSVNKEAFYGRAFGFLVMIATRIFTPTFHYHLLAASAVGAFSSEAYGRSHGREFGMLLLEPTQSFETSSHTVQLHKILFQLEGFVTAFSGVI